MLLDELERILTNRFQLPPELARLARGELETLPEVVVPDIVPAVSRNPDDDQVLAAAVGEAEAIVTGDRDLLVLEATAGSLSFPAFRMAGPTRQVRGRGHGSSRWSA